MKLWLFCNCLLIKGAILLLCSDVVVASGLKESILKTIMFLFSLRKGEGKGRGGVCRGGD